MHLAMNIIELYFKFERWTKSERNQTVTSMSFNKTLKWVPDSSFSFWKHTHTTGWVGQKNVVSKNSWGLKYSLILFITLAMSQPSKLPRWVLVEFSPLNTEKILWPYFTVHFQFCVILQVISPSLISWKLAVVWVPTGVYKWRYW